MKHSNRVTLTTPTPREVVFIASFDAPRQLVFDALTRPEYLSRWLDAPGRKMEVCEVDLRAGGEYRWIWRGPGKKDVGMHGVFREVVPGKRYVRTEAWMDWDAGEIVVTVDLTEADGQTQATTATIFPSQEVRDQVLQSGLKDNLDESFVNLAAVIEKLVQLQT